jgi:L-ribulose-5-phosphate 4-epimerase
MGSVMREALSFPVERQQFRDVCQRAFALGMQVSTGGNLSIRLEDGLYLVKPSGISLLDLKEEEVLLVNRNGAVVEGKGKPTMEWNSHFCIYQVREDVGGIVHYHAPFAAVHVVSGKEVPLLTVHAKRIVGKVPLIGPAKEGSEELATLVGEVFSQMAVKAALLSGHGIMAVGRDLVSAQKIAELLEESAKIALLSRLL